MSTDKQIRIDAIPVPLRDGHNEFTVQIRDPGVVHSVGWTLEDSGLVMAGGRPQFREVLTMFVEFSPTGPLRNRRFTVMATGQGITVAEGHKLGFIGTALSARTGQVAHVFEVRANYVDVKAAS